MKGGELGDDKGQGRKNDCHLCIASVKCLNSVLSVLRKNSLWFAKFNHNFNGRFCLFARTEVIFCRAFNVCFNSVYYTNFISPALISVFIMKNLVLQSLILIIVTFFHPLHGIYSIYMLWMHMSWDVQVVPLKTELKVFFHGSFFF